MSKKRKRGREKEREREREREMERLERKCMTKFSKIVNIVLEIFLIYQISLSLSGSLLILRC